MNLDGPLLIGLAALVLTILGVVTTWAIRINKGENALDHAKAAQAAAEEGRKELSDYKVHVAETYVSHSAMAEVERRLTDSINAVGNRLERLFHPTPPSA